MSDCDETHELVPVSAGETRRHEAEEDPIRIGQWYWFKQKKVKDDKLACVVHVGSNYVKLESADHWTWRIHLDEFDTRCHRALNPEDHIRGQIYAHQQRVNALMDNVKQLTATLGITRRALDAGESNTALAVAHGVADVKAHKEALIKAKKETLPDLFKRIEEEHKGMAMWMKAELLPMQAQAHQLRSSTSAIEDRIFTVELYAGLIENVELIRDGELAGDAEPIHLLQRRHYMDEECLVDYTTGGMEFKDIERFDRWLLKTKTRRERIFPFPRCMVAFRVRRNAKEYKAERLVDFISIFYKDLENNRTFLYIRNGERYYRLTTGIDFGERLFPDRTYDINVGGKEDSGPLYAHRFSEDVNGVITKGEYLQMKRENAEALKQYKLEVKAWEALSEEEKKGKCLPWHHQPHNIDRYEPCTLESVYYDDAMRFLAKKAMEHNRVATVLQGLLDRSPVFAPHPPWQLWTPEGFSLALRLVYDDSRALTDGEKPDFEAYRKSLNAQLKVGCYTVGQQAAWERHEAEKRYRGRRRVSDYYQPFGNPGPGLVARVARFGRKRDCTYEWERERLTVPAWRSWRDVSETITTRFTCPANEVFNVSAYTPGDYKRFYADPRTRAEYLQWAPLLLAAEDWHAAQKKKTT